MNIKTLISKLSIKEKIAQLALSGSHEERVLPLIKDGVVGNVLNNYGVEQVNRLQKASLDSLNIPLLVGDDVIHGYRSIYPLPVGMACTFNLDLISDLVKMATEEASIEGINWIYSPMLDIARDPRWGRIMETNGEDPYYSSLIAERHVKAIQTPLKDGRVTAACCKHFIGYGACEAGLDYNTTDYSEYTLKTVYVPPFRRGINAGAMSVMNAFTTYNSQAITGSKYILKDLLREELGFKGVLVSDWACPEQLKVHRMVKDDFEAAIRCLNLGLDIDMHDDVYVNYLEKAIKENPSLEEKLDESVERVLQMKKDMGLFDHPYVLENAYEMLSKENKALCKQGAKESVLLFKNDNDVLPLKENEKVLFVGPLVEEKENHIGSWGCKGQKEYVTSLKEALGNKTNVTLINTSYDLSDLDYSLLSDEIKKSDKVVLCLGEPREMSGENNNRQNLDVPFNQESLVDFVKTFNKPVITWISAGRSLVLTHVDKVTDALVFTFHLGIEAGSAMVDVLYGNYNPSAKTVVTFPYSLGQVPIYYNHYQTGRPELSRYVDGPKEPLYPFGYGLHYGKLNITNVNVDYTDKLNIKCTLENESIYDINETLQVYLNIPYYKTLVPVKQFIGYHKVDVEKNTNKNIEFSIDLDSFLPCDLDKNQTLYIEVGTSSMDITSHEIKTRG